MRQDGFAQAYAAIQHRLAALFHEIDARLGHDIGDFYAEDGVLVVGGTEYAGRDRIARFYADRAGRIAVEQKDGTRTARHLVLNLRLAPREDGRAGADFVLLYFSGEGRPPLSGPIAPTVVADCRMQLREDVDGAWRIARFDSTPLFIGDDPFMKKAIGGGMHLQVEAVRDGALEDADQAARHAGA